MIGKRKHVVLPDSGEPPKELLHRVCRALRVSPTEGFSPEEVIGGMPEYG